MDVKIAEMQVLECDDLNSNSEAGAPLSDFQLALVGGGCGEVVFG